MRQSVFIDMMDGVGIRIISSVQSLVASVGDDTATETPAVQGVSATPDRPAHPSRGRALVQAAVRFRGADATALAAETAYFSILAIAPFLLFLIAGIAIISQYVPITLVDDLERTVERMAPGDTGELLLPLVEEAVDRSASGTLSFGMFSAIVVAMWSGSRAVSSLIKGVARMSGSHVNRPLIRNRLLAMGLAAVLGIVTLLSFAIFLFGNALGRGVAVWAGLGDTFSETIWPALSWPLVAGIVLLVVSVFYWIASGVESERVAFISEGAVAATALWVLVMFGIRIFLLIISPGSIYGALGSFVVLVVFFYIMGLALLYGAALNAELRGDPDAEPV